MTTIVWGFGRSHGHRLESRLVFLQLVPAAVLLALTLLGQYVRVPAVAGDHGLSLLGFVQTFEGSVGLRLLVALAALLLAAVFAVDFLLVTAAVTRSVTVLRVARAGTWALLVLLLAVAGVFVAQDAVTFGLPAWSFTLLVTGYTLWSCHHVLHVAERGPDPGLRARLSPPRHGG